MVQSKKKLTKDSLSSKPILLHWSPFLLLLAGGLVYAHWVQLPLYMDGSLFFYNFFSQGELYYDALLRRVSDVLLQVPSWIIFQAGESDSVFFFAKHVLFFCYLWHPLASLGLCYWIIKQQKLNPFYFCLPLLSAFLHTMPTLQFAVGSGVVSVSVFWPLFLLLLSKDRDLSLLEFFPALVGLILIHFSYDVGMLFLLLISFDQMRMGRHHRYRMILALVSLGLSISMLTYSLTRSAEVKGLFFKSLTSVSDIQLYSIVLTLGFLIFSIFSLKSLQKLASLVAIFSVLYFVLHFSDWSLSTDSFAAYHSRVYAVPLAFLWALAGLCLGRGGVFDGETPFFREFNWILILVTSVSMTDFIVSARTFEGRLQKLSDHMKEQETSCVSLPSEIIFKQWEMNPIYISTKSVFLNSPSRVKKIVVSHPGREPEKKHCRIRKEEGTIDNYVVPLIYKTRKFFYYPWITND